MPQDAKIDRMNKSLKELINSAKHDSVNEKYLTQFKDGFFTRFLHIKPLINYLRPDEQPHFIMLKKGIPTVEGRDPPEIPEIYPSGRVMHTVSDRRWLFVVSTAKSEINRDGEKDHSIYFEDINEVSTKDGSEVKIITDENTFKIPIGRKHRETAKEAIKHIKGEMGKSSLHSTLISYDDDNGVIKVEGWTGGPSKIQASLDADVKANAETKGTTKGVNIGAFTYAKNVSKSSISGRANGEIEGEISDNTYTSEITSLKIFDDRIYLDSGLEMDIYYDEIDRLMKEGQGMVLQMGETTFRIQSPSESSISSDIDYIQERIADSNNKTAGQSTTGDSEDTTSAEKLRELKELQEDGILTDEEFQSKKEELLDDF